MRLNVGCGEFYAPGWINVDVVDSDKYNIHPDLVVDVMALPDHIRDLDAVYCGHFLEHITEDQVTEFLIRIQRRMKPGAPFVAVGPDTKRATQMYQQGRLDKETMLRCHKSTEPAGWVGAGHMWDCHEYAVAKHMITAGLQEVEPIPIRSKRLNPYPVVARQLWQFAVIAKSPKE